MMAQKKPLGGKPENPWSWKEELLAASANGDTQNVIRLLVYTDFLCEVGGRQFVYTEAVHSAASRGHTEIIEHFLKTGFNVDCESFSRDGREMDCYETWTPLLTEGGQDIKRKMEKALFLNWKMEKA